MSRSRFIELNALYCSVDYLIGHSPMATYIDQAKLSKLTKDTGSCE